MKDYTPYLIKSMELKWHQLPNRFPWSNENYYYAKFIPNLATVLSPLYQLLSESVPWSWTTERDAAFKQAKSLLTSDCVLVHYDPEKDLMILCNASSYGLGAVLSHKFPDRSKLPIAFTS